MVITKGKEKAITKEQVARSPGLRLEAQLPAWPEASHASNVTAINRSLMIVRVCVAKIITSFYVRLPTTFELVTMILIELCTLGPHQDLWQNREDIVQAFPASQAAPECSSKASADFKVGVERCQSSHFDNFATSAFVVVVASAIMQFS